MKTQKEYLRDAGGCPRCDSGDLKGHSVEVEGDMAFQDITCLACGFVYYDKYVLEGYDYYEDQQDD